MKGLFDPRLHNCELKTGEGELPPLFLYGFYFKFRKLIQWMRRLIK